MARSRRACAAMAKHPSDDEREDEAPVVGAPPRGSFTDAEPPRRGGGSARLWIWLLLLGAVVFGGAFAVVNYLVMPHAVNHGDELLIPDLAGAPLDSAQ